MPIPQKPSSLNNSLTDDEPPLTSTLEDLRNVRVTAENPISPLDDRDDEDLREPFLGSPPRTLSMEEEYDRYKLQLVLSQVDDVGVIQSVVDVLAPLGAYFIDEKLGSFSFNLYMLEDSTIEMIKKISRFEEYDFEEDKD